MKKYLFIIGLVLIAVLLFGCTGGQQSSTQYSDIEIQSFRWEDPTSRPGPTTFAPIIHYDTSTGGFVGMGNLIVSSQKKLFFRVYVNEKLQTPLYGYGGVNYLVIGDNQILLYNFNFTSLSANVNFKVCFSADENFQKNPDAMPNDVICKEKSFPVPKVSVTVSPDPVMFTVNKSHPYEGDAEFPRKTIRITNTGEIQISISVVVPSYPQTPNYPKNYPSYYTRTAGGFLMPGESMDFQFAVMVGNEGEFNVSLGNYTSTGYVTFLYGCNKTDCRKEFTIITNVVEGEKKSEVAPFNVTDFDFREGSTVFATKTGTNKFTVLRSSAIVEGGTRFIMLESLVDFNTDVRDVYLNFECHKGSTTLFASMVDNTERYEFYSYDYNPTQNTWNSNLIGVTVRGMASLAGGSEMNSGSTLSGTKILKANSTWWTRDRIRLDFGILNATETTSVDCNMKVISDNPKYSIEKELEFLYIPD